MSIQIDTPKALLELIGTELGHSNWHDITQQRVDAFADSTEDHQWIHVDVERGATGPFGTTIAHGYLTVALAPAMINEVLEITDVGEFLNYGINKVRFPSPVPVGSRVRSRIDLVSTKLRDAGALEVVFRLTYELDGADRPPCIAELVFMYR